MESVLLAKTRWVVDLHWWEAAVHFQNGSWKLQTGSIPWHAPGKQARMRHPFMALKTPYLPVNTRCEQDPSFTLDHNWLSDCRNFPPSADGFENRLLVIYIFSLNTFLTSWLVTLCWVWRTTLMPIQACHSQVPAAESPPLLEPLLMSLVPP